MGSKTKKITVKSLLHIICRAYALTVSKHHLQNWSVIVLLTLILAWKLEIFNLTPAGPWSAHQKCIISCYILFTWCHFVSIKTRLFLKKILTTLCLPIQCTGTGVHSNWKFIYYTKHKVTSVSHINTLCKIEIKIALLPQAWNLLFIDKIREKEMVLCYEETVDYWFSNLWTGGRRDKSAFLIQNHCKYLHSD